MLHVGQVTAVTVVVRGLYSLMWPVWSFPALEVEVCCFNVCQLTGVSVGAVAALWSISNRKGMMTAAFVIRLAGKITYSLRLFRSSWMCDYVRNERS